MSAEINRMYFRLNLLVTLCVVIMTSRSDVHSCHYVSPQSVTCSGDFASLPPLDPTIRTLDISSNNIRALRNDTFINLILLEDLVLEENGIHLLEPAVFTKLQRLRLLSLRNNALSSISTDTFKYNKALERLDLSDNPFIVPPNLHAPTVRWLKLNRCNIQILTTKTFENLKNLNILQINGNSLQLIDKKTFEPLSNLQELSLTDNQLKSIDFSIPKTLISLKLDRNDIAIITSASFKAISSLQYLYISKNNIRHIEKDALSTFHNLRYIDLGENLLTDIENDTFQNMLNLRYLRLSCNSLHFLPIELFETTRRLESLQMDGNILTKLNVNLFLDLNNLRFLNLSTNKLLYLESKQFYFSNRIEQLDLSNNMLEDIPDGLLVTLRNLSYFSLSGNRIANINNSTFNYNAQLLQLDLSENSVKFLEADVFSKLKKLELLNLSGNRIKSFPESCLNPMINLLQLDVSSNELLNLSTVNLKDLQQLQGIHLDQLHITEADLDNLRFALRNVSVLSLSRNNIIKVNIKTFIHYTNLKKLDLSYNKLTQFNLDFLSASRELQELNLMNNELIFVSVTADFRKLTQINLRGNKFKSLPMSLFLKCANLKYLDLSMNDIQTLGINTVNLINNATVVNSTRNPLPCDCNLKKLWQRSTQNIVVTCRDGESGEKPWQVLQGLSCYHLHRALLIWNGIWIAVSILSVLLIWTWAFRCNGLRRMSASYNVIQLEELFRGENERNMRRERKRVLMNHYLSGSGRLRPLYYGDDCDDNDNDDRVRVVEAPSLVKPLPVFKWRESQHRWERERSSEIWFQSNQSVVVVESSSTNRRSYR